MLDPKTSARLDNDYTYHPPKPDQPAIYGQIRAKAKELALLVCELTPESRERSVALTKIDEAVFWTNAGLARNG